MTEDGRAGWTDDHFAAKWGWPAFWALLAIVAQLPVYDRSIVPMDEGHLLTTVDAMLDGRRLYVDLHTGIFPGIYLIGSGLLSLFGREVLVTRWAAVGVNVATVVALWQIGRRCMAPHWAALAPILHLVLVVVAFPVLSMFNYSTLAVAFGLLGLLMLLRYLESGARRDAFLLGLFVAGAALTKQNFGALIFLALLLALIWSRSDSILATRSWTRILFPIAASGACLTLGVVLYFAARGSLLAMVDSTILSIAGPQFQDFNNPIPPLLGPHPAEDGRFLFLYTPPTLFNALLMGDEFAGLRVTPLVRSLSIRASYGIPILALIVASVLLAVSLRKGEARNRRASRSVVLFAVVFSPGIFPSAIWSHLAFVMVPILLLFGFCADRIEGLITRPSWRAAVLTWRGVVAALAILAAGVGLDAAISIIRWNPEPLALDRAHGIRVSPRSHALITGAVHYLDLCAREGEPVLVLPDIPIVYFLADRPNPSPFDLAIPGTVDGPMIVYRAEQAGVRCAVVNPRMYPEFPPLHEIYPRVHNYLAQGFQTVEVIQTGDSRWLGMRRKTQ
ncbi:MAG: glycosyltransferase family 39 protein [Myxococcota bacterium]